MERRTGPNREERPENPVDQAFTVARILTGETTEDEVREKLEAEESGEEKSSD